ncbi:DUF692 domain-containing protein [Bacillus licheniformis]|uniref:DUF692 domain-containing protein n=1 Tax=Bacillus licheniformis TaxID=1402 RepID=UPI00214F24CC|nr:DUF692 domain-containing protein [Bacillus licheniformis]MCR3917447.1 DUF692 domain-containing protein [Bacillus licheniformis]
MSNCIGVGLSFRQNFFKDLDVIKQDVDFLEIISERYFDKKNEEELNTIRNYFPLIPHGLSLSIGTYEPLSKKKEKQISNLLAELQINSYTDHLAMSSVKDIELLDFFPVMYKEETFEFLINKYDQLKKGRLKNLYLENITYTFNWHNNDFSELDFWYKLLNETNIGMLLDVSNLYINSINHKYDPYAFFDKLPKDKINYLHVAGFIRNKYGFLIDSHSKPVHKEVWKLAEYIIKKAPVKGVILERDLNYQNYHDVKNDIKIIKSLVYKYQTN